MAGMRGGLAAYLEGLPVVNTHAHHLESSEFQDFDLDALLDRSYVAWMRVPRDGTRGGRAEYLGMVRHTSRFLWLERALQSIHGFGGPLTPDNWQDISDLVARAHRDPAYHLRLLTQTCGYRRIILDAYWNPGGDNGLPAFFAPAFRVDMFLVGYDREAKDRDGHNPLAAAGLEPMSMEAYAVFMREAIAAKARAGCVALKCTMAYDRGLDAAEAGRGLAEKAIQRGARATPEEIRAYQDYVLFELCRIAAELGLPMQFHTGLGSLARTNALWLLDLIAKNPATTFVLFHGGYPWLDDIMGLVHNFQNVHVDLCWLPLLAPSAARRLTHELIEVAAADRVCWGCDTWTSEESYGALLAVRHVLACTLGERIEDGLMTEAGARRVAGNILYENARRLYKLRELPALRLEA